MKVPTYLRRAESHTTLKERNTSPSLNADNNTSYFVIMPVISQPSDWRLQADNANAETGTLGLRLADSNLYS